MTAHHTQVRSYRLLSLIVSLVALALAFWSKYYSGPYYQLADAYLGDVFIVMCLYFGLALAFSRLSILKKFLTIAIVACSVELLQFSGWPASLNMPEPFVFILGTSFDPRDFIFYAIGLSLAAAIDGWLYKICRVKNENI